MAPPRNVSNKFDPAEQYRDEIEDRTAAGETCEQIAAALRSRGVDITNKTISRRRVEWGLRKRQYATHKKPDAARQRTVNPAGRVASVHARKAEIEARTARGETADQIAAALAAQGHSLKRGSSDILRLQTTWGLIPPDRDRNRGIKRKRSDGRKKESAAPKLSKREREKEANARQRTQTLHYPTDCSFGPSKKGVNDAATAAAATDDDGMVDSSIVSPPQPHSPVQAFNNYPASSPVATSPSRLSTAAEIMSVEFLVDLATSTLSAATDLKTMLLAHQSGVPVAGSQSQFPPTREDLSLARRKVREAASVMHDLAAEPVADDAPS